MILYTLLFFKKFDIIIVVLYNKTKPTDGLLEGENI